MINKPLTSRTVPFVLAHKNVASTRFIAILQQVDSLSGTRVRVRFTRILKIGSDPANECHRPLGFIDLIRDCFRRRYYKGCSKRLNITTTTSHARPSRCPPLRLSMVWPSRSYQLKESHRGDYSWYCCCCWPHSSAALRRGSSADPGSRLQGC